MNLNELEYKLVNNRKEEIVSFLNKCEECFEQVIKYSISDKQPLGWRSAWLLSHCMKENDLRIRNYIEKILKVIETKTGGHQRELIKLLSKIELTEEQEGRLFNICMTVWEEINRTPSERLIAIRFIIKVSEKYSELMSEISFLLQDRYLEDLSPGVKHSVKKMKKKLGL